ncbi:hypothetical protein [Zobellella sp. DQSA1]|uniref:hypothetical protein n=1 Tax=Zobellella sp. DQSA1 TaxID=3342386 RepID=UPI0035C228CD
MMMITELIDQDDFRAQLQSWGLAEAGQLSLAECRPLLALLLAGPNRALWQERLEALLAKRELLHPEVLALVEESLG